MTVTDVDTLTEFPATSVTVAVTVKVSSSSKTWDATAVPVTAPRFEVSPSPQFTRSSRTALPFCAAAVTANVKLAGSPTLGGDDGGVITSDGADATFTTTVPDA